jgi:small subunit ribosomal protein S4e
MAKKGGDFRVKRQLAPTFWNIKRKESQFVLRVKPGSHPKRRAYPLGIIIRDVLKIANTMHEAETIVNAGKVKVDGIIRRDIHFGIGLMDIVELAPTGQAYRFVPKDSRLLLPVNIKDDEKLKKLIKITSKAVIRGGKLQYGFHDGKTLISDQNMSVGDTCLVQLPESKINEHLRFERGSIVLVTRGENAGGIGKIEDIKDGIFSLPKHALVSFAERSVELPVEIVMTVGSQRPIIGVD